MSEWYDTFLEALYKKYPKKSELTKALTDLLLIERESVYRRLRKEIIFSVHEFYKIAFEWSISLDEIIRFNSEKVIFQMQPINYLAPSEKDMDFVQKGVRALEQLKDCSNSEHIVVTNNLSRSFTSGFPSLYKFNIFKWAYQYGKEETNIMYSQIIIPKKMVKEIETFHRCMRYVTNTSYIWDNMIFDNMVREIQFFQSIFLVTDEDKEIIKKDLYALLDYLQEVANTGCFPETKNKVQIYISMLNLNTCYSYLHDGEKEACGIHAFNMHDSITYDPNMIENFKVWMQRKKRTSIQISEVDERSRIEFFRKQRELIDTL